MGLDSVQSGKLLYHLTGLKNMESIIENGLLPRYYLKTNQCSFEDIADPHIISKRTELGLDRYNPFHFHPYSAFDVAVKNKHSNEIFVYICIKRALAEFNHFKILIKHPLSQSDCILYDYNEGINKIDWETMKKVGTTDEYSKNVKMAECLTEQRIPAELFQCVYVPDTNTKNIVEDLFKKNGITEQPPYVAIQEKWFE